MAVQGSSGLRIDPLTAEDWQRVREIYLEGIATGNATFEKFAPEWREWNEAHLQACRFVARVSGEIGGWAALSPASRRKVYVGVAEVSVYVSEHARRRSIGMGALNGVDCGVRARGHLDATGGHFPGEYGQHRAAQTSRLPHSRCPRAPRLPRWTLARRRAHGAEKRTRRYVSHDEL